MINRLNEDFLLNMDILSGGVIIINIDDILFNMFSGLRILIVRELGFCVGGIVVDS